MIGSLHTPECKAVGRCAYTCVGLLLSRDLRFAPASPFLSALFASLFFPHRRFRDRPLTVPKLFPLFAMKRVPNKWQGWVEKET